MAESKGQPRIQPHVLNPLASAAPLVAAPEDIADTTVPVDIPHVVDRHELGMAVVKSYDCLAIVAVGNLAVVCLALDGRSPPEEASTIICNPVGGGDESKRFARVGYCIGSVTAAGSRLSPDAARNVFVVVGKTCRDAAPLAFLGPHHHWIEDGYRKTVNAFEFLRCLDRETLTNECFEKGGIIMPWNARSRFVIKRGGRHVSARVINSIQSVGLGKCPTRLRAVTPSAFSRNFLVPIVVARQ